MSKSIGYAYNLDGSLKSLTYPSGRIVNYAYDSAAHPLSALDANGAQYISNATYWPSGAQYQSWRPNIYLRTDLNKRLQIAGFYSDNGQVASFYLNKTYNYGAQNNGNIMSITNNKDASRTENFTYDALNRITSGWTNGNTGAYSWGENYTIDAWGNLMMSPMASKAHGGTWQCAGDASNRANCLSYDAAGNVTANGGAGYTYDAENRLASAGGMTYLYDADGNRVKKASGSTGTLYWYGSPGIIAESDLTGALKSEYVFFGGKRVARVDLPANSVHYYLSDHLGSTSMVVSSTGTPEEESDYSPFGTEYVVTGGGANRYKYTGKERDSESGLDYFGARNYANTLGRFLTVDPGPYLTQDAQALNRYAYARNNPMKYIDPNGKTFVVAADQQLTIQQNISTLLRSNAGRQLVNKIANDPRPTFVGSGSLPRVQNPSGTTSVTNGTTTLIPGSTPGPVVGTNITLDPSNIAFTGTATGQGGFQVGLTAFTHELEHVSDANGAQTLQGAAAANAAGDAPSVPGANDTTGGSAEARAQAIVSGLGSDANSFDPNSQTDSQAAAIVQAGQQAYANQAQQQITDAITIAEHPDYVPKHD